MRIHINAEVNLEEAIERIRKDGSPLFTIDCNEIDIVVTAFNLPESDRERIQDLEEIVGQKNERIRSLEHRIDELLAEVRRAQAAAQPKLDLNNPIDANKIREAIKHDLQFGNKINAIKTVREMTGSGLKEAKDFVDQTVVTAGHQVGANTNLATPVNILDTIVKEF